MSDNCEYKNGTYVPCKSAFENYIDLGTPYDNLNRVFKRGYKAKFCPFCGADIRKPKEKTDKIYLLINGEKFVIDFDDTAEKVEKLIAKIIKRKTGILAKVEIMEADRD